jgi:hypothetical protein
MVSVSQRVISPAPFAAGFAGGYVQPFIWRIIAGLSELGYAAESAKGAAPGEQSQIRDVLHRVHDDLLQLGPRQL